MVRTRPEAKNSTANFLGVVTVQIFNNSKYSLSSFDYFPSYQINPILWYIAKNSFCQI